MRIHVPSFMYCMLHMCICNFTLVLLASQTVSPGTATALVWLENCMDWTCRVGSRRHGRSEGWGGEGSRRRDPMHQRRRAEMARLHYRPFLFGFILCV